MLNRCFPQSHIDDLVQKKKQILFEMQGLGLAVTVDEWSTLSNVTSSVHVNGLKDLSQGPSWPLANK